MEAVDKKQIFLQSFNILKRRVVGLSQVEELFSFLFYYDRY